ncbi:hypothetical protein AWB71_00923 [Caballeronia peredens]|nr:hypothetical protein AWB71_00923 [Caballeronia peredens]
MAKKIAPTSEAARNQAAKLHALIHLISGEGQDYFDRSADSIRASVLWLMGDLAEELLGLTDFAARTAIGSEVGHD